VKNEPGSLPQRAEILLLRLSSIQRDHVCLFMSFLDRTQSGSEDFRELVVVAG
jgi:hypothetical protein